MNRKPASGVAVCQTPTFGDCDANFWRAVTPSRLSPAGHRQSRARDHSLGHRARPCAAHRDASRSLACCLGWQPGGCLPHRARTVEAPSLPAPHPLPQLAHMGGIGPGSIVEALVALLQQRTKDTMICSPRGMVVDRCRGPRRPHEDLQAGRGFLVPKL